MTVARPRGEPLLVLGLLLASWIGARAFAWEYFGDRPAVLAEDDFAATVDVYPAPSRLFAARGAAGMAAAAGPPAAAAGHVLAAPSPVTGHVLAAPVNLRVPMPVPVPVAVPVPVPAPGAAALPLSAPVLAPAAPAAAPALPTEPGTAARRMATAGGHQLLWLAAAAMLPMPADLVAPRRPPLARAPAALPRWSGDGWLFLRQGGAGLTFPRTSGAGSYGASQAGAVLRYRLAPADPHRPTAYLRAAGALGSIRQQEVAVGLAARPLSQVPVAAMAEVRATRDGRGTAARPAVALVSELPPLPLPLGIRAEAYVQAGYVGGGGASGFVDGLVRAERDILATGAMNLRAGAGAWGAKQRGASRLDVGPVAAFTVRLGDTASARIEADWRFRVAGRAEPGSGPALTLSAGF